MEENNGSLVDFMAMDVTTAHEVLVQQAKEKAVSEIRFISAISVGQAVRQGDVYIHAVDTKHRHGEELKDNQLAIGNTVGSRHVAQKPATCHEGKAYPTWCSPDTFLGPLIVAKERFVITHPEHAHVSLPAGIYQVTHQATFDIKAKARRRAKD